MRSVTYVSMVAGLLAVGTLVPAGTALGPGDQGIVPSWALTDQDLKVIDDVVRGQCNDPAWVNCNTGDAVRCYVYVGGPGQLQDPMTYYSVSVPGVGTVTVCERLPGGDALVHPKATGPGSQRIAWIGGQCGWYVDADCDANDGNTECKVYLGVANAQQVWPTETQFWHVPTNSNPWYAVCAESLCPTPSARAHGTLPCLPPLDQLAEIMADLA